MAIPSALNVDDCTGLVDAAADSNAPRLGLLFVHGIGTQQEGVTLMQSGGPLLEWLRDWLELKGDPEIRQAVLKPSEVSGESRAHAEFLIEPLGESPQRIVLAESLWAAQFDPPPFRELCGWLLGYGAWVALRHFCTQTPDAMLRWVPFWIRSHLLKLDAATANLGAIVVAFVGLIFVVLPLQLFLVALYVLALVPLQAVKDWVVRLGVRISEIIGDSYVFVSNPLARAAITHKLLTDLAWLEERCGNEIPIVILAHSQGAAVAFDALRGRRSSRPVRLITYGAGIRRLFEIESEIRSDSLIPKLIRMVWPIVLLAVLASEAVRRDLLHIFSLPVAEMAGAYDPDAHFGILFLLGIYLFFFVTAGMVGGFGRAAESKVDERLKPEMLRFLEGEVRWRDFVASNDPVPDGRLLQSAACVWLEDEAWRSCNGLPVTFGTSRVNNQRSAIADHTSYWGAPDDFIMRVGVQLNEWAQLGWLRPDAVATDEAVGTISRTRGVRVGLRNTAHFLLAVGTIIMAFQLMHVWRPAMAQSEQMPVVRGILSPLRVLFFLDEHALQTLRVHVLGIGAHLLVVWLYVRLVSEPLWNWWDALFTRRRLSRGGLHLRGWGRLFAWLLALVVPLGGIAQGLRADSYWPLYHIVRDPFTQSTRYLLTKDYSSPGGLISLTSVLLACIVAACLLQSWMAKRYSIWASLLTKPPAPSPNES